MALISQSDLQARLGRSLTSDEQAAFTVINEAAQTYIENIIGSSVETAQLTARFYDGGVQHLKVDPYTDLSKVELVDDDENVVHLYDDTDYQEYPRNRTLKYALRHRNYFMTGLDNIKVTAKFSVAGDEDTLNVVKDALLEYLENELANNDNIKKESIEGYSVEYANAQSVASLDKLKYLFPEV